MTLNFPIGEQSKSHPQCLFEMAKGRCMQKRLFALIIGFVCCLELASCTTDPKTTVYGEDMYSEDGMSYDPGKLSELR